MALRASGKPGRARKAVLSYPVRRLSLPRNALPADKQAMCGGTPAGDNWEAWNADFFTPAAKLLAAAPWGFSRGNHEDCERSWRGWFYYLDPRPWNGTCERFSSPYLVTLGTFELVMLDSASVSANTLNKEQAAL